MRLARLLFFVLFISSLLCALSQAGDETNKTAAIFYEADGYYNKVLQQISSKNISEAEEERLNKKALDGYTRFLKTNAIRNPLLDSLVFISYVKAGELAHYFDSLPQALDFYNAAIIHKDSKLSDTFLFKPLVFSGILYYSQNQLDSAFARLKKAEAVRENSGLQLEGSERLYNSLGSIYFEYGNYRQAKNYFQKAAEILQPSNPSYSALFVNYRMNLATALFKLEDFDAANAIYQSLLKDGSLYENQIYNNLGLIQLYLGAAPQAIQYLQKVSYNNALSVGLYNDIANSYFNLKAFDSTRKYLAKASEKNKAYNPSHLSIDYGRTLKIYGDVEKEEGHYNDALTYYQQALHHFYPAFRNNDINSNPEKFTGVFSYINLFQALVSKAETFQALFTQTKNLQHGNLALATYTSAFSLIEYVEKTYDSDEARLFLTKIKYAVHEKPIDLAFELYTRSKDKNYLKSLYQFDQQNKAAVLVLNRQLNSATDIESSPLLQNEQRLKAVITRLSIQAAQAKDSAQLVAINKHISDAEIELGSVREKLYASSPLIDISIPSIEQLQELLDEQTALVSYHLSNEKLTTILITKDNFDCYQQVLPLNFEEKIQAVILDLKSPALPDAGKNINPFYELLLSKIAFQRIEQLVVIPDDVLAYFPFESLRNKEGNYLIEKVAVQYQFSTALLGKNKTDFSNAQTLSLAPFAHSSLDSRFAKLPASAEEITPTKGKKLIDAAATKNAFLQQSKDFKILHLATHAVANEAESHLSYIAFAPITNGENLLYAQEIYNLPLKNTGLVILSACETGAGQLVKGEGVLSLSRAFSYAGCPNIITSLWKADDFSTANITSRIHHYLQKGFAISKAVRQAKVDYLHDRKINPRLKQPYYWSHLVFVGNYTPTNEYDSTWLIIVGVIILALFTFLIKKPGKARHLGFQRRR